jgi:hypothetical protein
MDSLSEGPLMAGDYARCGEKLETRGRRMSFVRYDIPQSVLTGVM